MCTCSEKCGTTDLCPSILGLTSYTSRSTLSSLTSPPRHAILRPQADGIGVEDLDSLNGSFVNEDRLESTVVVRAGDVLQVGQTVVKISS